MLETGRIFQAHKVGDLEVECYAGSYYPERPRAVQWEGKRYSVDRVLALRRTPEEIGFQAQLSDGRIVWLFYHEKHDSWRIIV